MIYRTLSVLILLIYTSSAFASQSTDDTLRIEVLLTPKMIEEVHPENTLISSLDITSNHLLLLSTTNQFYLLGWGGITAIGEKSTGAISSFAFTSDSILMIIRDNELCVFDSAEILSRLYTLPDKGMGISAGKHVMYIYDHTPGKAKNAMYVIAHGGQYSKLFDVPYPINSVVEFKNDILFSNDNIVFRYNLLTKELKALASLPEGKSVRSLAVDPSSERVYFSTDDMVCALKDNQVVVITDKLGGSLKFLNGLIVFNPENKILVRLAGLNTAIDSKASGEKTPPVLSQPSKTLTNATIIDLKKNGLSDELIINLINRNKVDFNLNVDSMVELSNNNISSKVIMAMKQSMKKQSDNPQ